VDLTPLGGRGPFLLEKWYIDTLMEDGGVLLVYLGRVRVLGLDITGDRRLFLPDGESCAGAPRATIPARDPGFRPGPDQGERLRFETPGLSVSCLRPRYPAVALAEPFLARETTVLWKVSPDAHVMGKCAGHQAADRSPAGLSDQVWYDLLPWRFPIRELEWGRAAAGEHAATWVRATTPRGTVATGWLDGQADPEAKGAIVLGQSRVLVKSAVADLQVLRLGALRHLVRYLARDPVETKWAAPATIGEARGVAIHEVVQWR
jgi:hypothetical protein